jgi:membrane fusion protein
MPVPAASSLAVVLPKGAVLEAQLWAPSRAIGFVTPGDTVRLMFDAFPYQRFGVAKGKVLNIASTPTAPEDLPIPFPTPEPMYRITVALEAQTMQAYGQSRRLMPGARVNADLVLERRSFVEWLFAPVFAIARRNQA